MDKVHGLVRETVITRACGPLRGGNRGRGIFLAEKENPPAESTHTGGLLFCTLTNDRALT